MPSEFSITFSGAGGHDHSGIAGSGSLISTSLYSIFDWNTSTIGDQTRIERQVRNKQNLENWIIELVNSREISPRILKLKPASLDGKIIIDGTLEANKIIAGSITGPLLANGSVSGVNIAANTITANNIQTGTITGVKIQNNAITDDKVQDISIVKIDSDFTLLSNTIQSNVYTAGVSGWSIFANGDAEFNDVIVRGTVAGSTITGSTLTTDDGTNGIEITSDGYIRGTGGAGVRIKNSDGTAGTTSLFKDSINSKTLNCDYLNIKDTGTSNEVDINPTASHMADLIYYSNDSADSAMRIQRSGSAAASRHIVFAKTDTTYVGSIRYRANTNNVMVFEGDITGTSDIRLKQNIKILSNSLSIVNKIQPVEFNFIKTPDIVDHGFIAQDLYDVYPMAVEIGGEDPEQQPWSVMSARLIPVLTGAIKELSEKVNLLETRLNSIEGV